jgi:hypothetical protein
MAIFARYIISRMLKEQHARLFGRPLMEMLTILLVLSAAIGASIAYVMLWH